MIGDCQKVIKNFEDPEETIKKIILPYEDLFDLILKYHKAVVHERRDIMLKEYGKRDLNLTTVLIIKILKIF